MFIQCNIEYILFSTCQNVLGWIWCTDKNVNICTVFHEGFSTFSAYCVLTVCYSGKRIYYLWCKTTLYTTYKRYFCFTFLCSCTFDWHVTGACHLCRFFKIKNRYRELICFTVKVLFYTSYLCTFPLTFVYLLVDLFMQAVWLSGKLKMKKI